MSMPEALYAWAYLAQFASNPNAAVLKDIKRLFRYFKWTIENNCDELTFSPLTTLDVPYLGRVEENQLYGFVDSTHISEERSVIMHTLMRTSSEKVSTVRVYSTCDVRYEFTLPADVGA